VRVFLKKSDGGVATAMLMVVALWGASNTGTRFLVTSWPPVWVGAVRFLCGGAVSLAMLNWTNWLGPKSLLAPAQKKALWFRGGMTLAAHIVVFNLAMRFTQAAHVALYLGASPVWALVWEERPAWTAQSARRYGAALLALTGVIVLFWPSLRAGSENWIGEALGLTSSMLWAFFGWQGRVLGKQLSGAEISAHAMWRAGVLLLPVAIVETVFVSWHRQGGYILARSDFWQPNLIWVMIYCFIGGGVLAYALFYHALKHWPTSKVLLFHNLVPLSTMTWSHYCLGEKVTATFWLAMVFVIAGVILGQAKLERTINVPLLPAD